MYVCGDYNFGQDSENHSAAIAKMTNDGSINWYIEASGPIPGNSDIFQDRCMGIAHNEKTSNVAVLL